MTTGELIPLRPDIAAAIRGGDPEQGMETEADPLTGTLDQAELRRPGRTDGGDLLILVA